MSEPTIVESPYFQEATLNQPQLRNSIMAPRINGNSEIIDGTIFAKALVIGSQNWLSSLAWTATDYNTGSWSAGTLQISDGTVYNIDAGNTGNIAAKTFVYFDPTSSLTTLRMTTTYADAIGDSKILLAIIEAASDIDSRCVMTIFNGSGTTIDGNKITTGKIQSSNGLTYFDLDGGVIQISDQGGTTIMDSQGLKSDANFKNGSVTDSNNFSTSNTSFVDVTNMSLSFTLGREANVLIGASVVGRNDSASPSNIANAISQITCDGSQVGGHMVTPGVPDSSFRIGASCGGTSIIVHLAAGSHTLKLQVKSSGGTVVLPSGNPKTLWYVVLGSTN